MKPMLGIYFSLAEFINSPTATRLGIDNTPSEADLVRAECLIGAVLDPLRAYLNRPIRVNSGFRSPALNTAVNGSKTSSHRYGQAADIVVPAYRGLPELTPAEILRAVIDAGLLMELDQGIGYDPARGNFVHVSHTPRRDRRHELLWAPTGGGYVRVTEDEIRRRASHGHA